MTLFCPLVNIIVDLLLMGFFFLQMRASRKNARYTAMLAMGLALALLIGALFGLCTGARDIIIMAAMMNAGVLIFAGVSGIMCDRRSHSVLFFFAAIISLLALIVYLKA